MTASTSKDITKRIEPYLKEAVAVAFWIYFLCKMFVNDLDEYILPTHLLPFRLVITIVLFAVLWMVFGYMQTFWWFLYIICYPILLLFWRIAPLAIGNWPVLLVLAPVLYDIAYSFKMTTLLYGLAALSAAVIVTADSNDAIWPAVAFLIFFAGHHMFQAMRRAFRPSLFVALADLIKQLRSAIEKNTFFPIQMSPDTNVDAGNQKTLEQLYTYGHGIEYVSLQLQALAKKRLPDIYVVLHLIYAFIVLMSIFGFIHYGVFKLSPSAYFAPVQANLATFFSYSFGLMSNSSISTVRAESGFASVIAVYQVACAIFFVMVIVFTFTTILRERDKKDIDEVIDELRKVSVTIETKLVSEFEMNLLEVETFLTMRNVDVVNAVRALRGQPKIDKVESQEVTRLDLDAGESKGSDWID